MDKPGVSTARARVTSSGIAYEHVTGDESQPAIVLVHAGVADRRMWDAQVAALAGGPSLTRVDLRGFGESDAPGPEGWSHSGDVAEVIASLGMGRVHLVGASMGAGVAVEVALDRPGLVASLVLAPPGGSLLVTRTDDLRAFGQAESAALEAGDLDAAVEANVDTWVVGPGRTGRDVPPGVADRVRVMQRRAFELGDVVGEPEEPEVEPTDRLGELDVPVLVLVGAHDLDTTKDAADRLVAALPEARRVDWPDAAHLPSMEHPDRFEELLRGWLAEHA